MEFEKRIIIGGPPRTGSTLFRFALDRLPGVVAPPETEFFLSSWRTRSKAQFVARKLKLPVRTVRKAQLRNRGFRGEVGVFDDLMGEVCRRKGSHAIAWAEKTPRNCFEYKRLNNEYPELLFVSTVRHPLDVITSRLGDSHEYYCGIERWMASAEAVLDFDVPNHFIVRYEDLVSNPSSCLRRILDQIGLEFSPVMLDRMDDGVGMRDFSLVTQPKLRHDIVRDWVGRFRHEQYSERISEFIATPGAVDLLERSGYEMSE